jgi:hypothetical protein
MMTSPHDESLAQIAALHAELLRLEKAGQLTLEAWSDICVQVLRLDPKWNGESLLAFKDPDWDEELRARAARAKAAKAR